MIPPHQESEVFRDGKQMMLVLTVENPDENLLKIAHCAGGGFMLVKMTPEGNMILSGDPVRLGLRVRSQLVPWDGRLSMVGAPLPQAVSAAPPGETRGTTDPPPSGNS